MTRIAIACRLAAVIVSGLLASEHSLAASEETPKPLSGETVRVIVSNAPGGGFDAYARMIAPHLARAVGGTVIVENLPGAGGMLALNKLYAAPPDGRTLMVANGTGAALAQILGEPAVRYDLAQAGHLGTISTAPWMWLVSPSLPVHSPADALRRSVPMLWSATGPVDGPSDGAAFACEALKLACRIVIGYRGSSDAVLAVGRGEVDAIYLADNSALSYVNAGHARAIAAMGQERSRLFPQVPTIHEAARIASGGEWLLGFRKTLESLRRIVIAPPGMSGERLDYLRASLRQALAEPALVAEGERTRRHIGYVDGKTTQTNVVSVLERLTAEQRSLVRHVVSKAQ